MPLTNCIKKLFATSLLFASIAYPNQETNNLATYNSDTITQDTSQNPLEIIDAMRLEQIQSLELIIGPLAEIINLKNANALESLGEPVQLIQTLKDNPTQNLTPKALYDLLFFNAAIITCFEQLLTTEGNSEVSLESLINLPQLAEKKDVSIEEVSEIAQMVQKSFDVFINALDSELREIFTQLITEQRKQLTMLENILQTITFKINTGNYPNKGEIRNAIGQLRNEIRLIHSTINGAEVSPMQINSLYAIIGSIADHIAAACSHKFSQLGQIDQEEMLKRLANEPMSFKELASALEKMTDTIVSLEALVDRSDLSFASRLARACGDYIVNPAVKYHKEIILTATAAGIAGYLWYYWGGDSSIRHWKLPQWMRSILCLPDAPVVGSPQEYDLGGNPARQGNHALNTLKEKGIQLDPKQLSPADQMALEHIQNSCKKRKGVYGDVGYIGLVEELVKEFVTGRLPILAALTGGFAYFGKEAWSEYKVGDKIYAAFNKLRGGVYNGKGATKSLNPVTFDDVIGMDHAKEMMNHILKGLQDYERWYLAGITLPNAILFTGETRSGKTHFARAIKGEADKLFGNTANFRFEELSLEMIRQLGIKNILEYAKQQWAPCILFVDEIHLLGLQDVGNSSIFGDFLTALSGLDGTDPKKPVILIAATNKPETIGKALRQKGRFGVEVRFDYPSLEERKEYLAHQFEHHAINPMIFGLDLDALARQTENCKYEQINDIISAAFKETFYGKTMSQELLEKALDTEIRKIMINDAEQIPKAEKELIAAFWAGTILANRELNSPELIARCTIKPVVTDVKEVASWNYLFSEEKDTGKVRGLLFTYHDHDTLGLETEDGQIKHAKSLLAGRIGQKVITGTCNTYRGSSRQRAYDTIQKVLTNGLDLKVMPKAPRNELNAQSLVLLNEYEAHMTTILQDNKDVLTALTHALLEKETLTGEQIENVIRVARGQEPINYDALHQQKLMEMIGIPEMPEMN